MSFNEFIGVTTLLYALANPIGVVPIFLGLLERLDRSAQLRVIGVATFWVTGLLCVAILLGRQTLEFFNVGLDDFRIAGGLLALFIAFEMFQAHYGGFMQTLDERKEAEKDLHSIAVTPLAFPLLIGPAELGVMITLSNDAHELQDKLWLIAGALMTGALIAVTLLLGHPLSRLMGKTGINVATRIMALIVAAIGVNFIVTGIKNLFPELAA